MRGGVALTCSHIAPPRWENHKHTRGQRNSSSACAVNNRRAARASENRRPRGKDRGGSGGVPYQVTENSEGGSGFTTSDRLDRFQAQGPGLRGRQPQGQRLSGKTDRQTYSRRRCLPQSHPLLTRPVGQSQSGFRSFGCWSENIQRGRNVVGG